MKIYSYINLRGSYKDTSDENNGERVISTRDDICKQELFLNFIRKHLLILADDNSAHQLFLELGPETENGHEREQFQKIVSEIENSKEKGPTVLILYEIEDISTDVEYMGTTFPKFCRENKIVLFIFRKNALMGPKQQAPVSNPNPTPAEADSTEEIGGSVESSE